MTELAPGDRIGNYRVERIVGRDASCSVYEASHAVLPRRAVVKVMHSQVAQADAAHVLREACILEALRHPGVARVYESGTLLGRRPWFAREHVRGPTLATVMASPRPMRPNRPSGLDLADVVALVRDLAEVLEHAHQRFIVHAGLIPARVLLTAHMSGFPLCVADWSGARLISAQSGVAPGGPRAGVGADDAPYVAPELAAGEGVDERTDVFALGALARQMLAAVEPDGPPRELELLVERMLAPLLEERPRSAEVRTALAHAADHIAQAADAVAPRIRRPRWTPAPLEGMTAGEACLDACADPLVTAR